MARDQHGDDINPYDLSHVAAVRKGTLYPTPREPHSAADLLAPLAADNARLQRERNAWVERAVELADRVAELEAACEAALSWFDNTQCYGDTPPEWVTMMRKARGGTTS